MANKFTRKVLPNGMTILFEKRDLPIVSVAFAVRNGGINEKSDEKGISHFIEHMLYKGTPTRNSKQIAEEIEKSGGELNGFTDEEITAYWCKMPARHFSIALNVLADMVKNPLLDSSELEKERKVIYEEIKMRRDTPRVFVFDEIQSYLYNPPFGEGLIGTEKTLGSINREKMVLKFKQIYAPQNMILCVVGNADFDKIVSFVERNFNYTGGEVPQLKIETKNEIHEVKREGIDQANAVLAFHLPCANDPKNYAAQVLMTLIGGGMSSRLFSEIREKRNLAYAIRADANINRDFSYGVVYVGTTPDKVEECKKLILEEFEKVSNDLGEEELNEIKEQMIGNYQISMEDSQTQMIQLLSSEIYGNAEEFYEFEKNIVDVKLEDVKDLAKIKEFSFLSLLPA